MRCVLHLILNQYATTALAPALQGSGSSKCIDIIPWAQFDLTVLIYLEFPTLDRSLQSQKQPSATKLPKFGLLSGSCNSPCPSRLRTMDLLPSIGSLWVIGSIVIAGTGILITLAQIFSIPILPILTPRGRKLSTARTPPRSFSPDKKPATSAASSSNHASILPPQRRHALKDLRCAAAPWRDVSEDQVRRNLLPMSADYRTSPSDKYTPMGFSVKEIEGLAEFPDYATLSGVPLPSPYPEFDIAKALPRPYRPFRWAYHQTMCRSTYSKLDHKSSYN